MVDPAAGRLSDANEFGGERRPPHRMTGEMTSDPGRRRR
jgi:hypothetical protein